MKICVIAQRVPYPPNKGEKLRTYHQIQRLVELGHEVEVLAPVTSEDDTKNADALAKSTQVTVSTFPLQNAFWRYAWALLHRQPLSVGAFYSPLLAKKVKQLLCDSRVDVMLLSASSLSYYVFANDALASSSCKLFMDFMDVDSDKWQQYAAASRWPMTWVYQREAALIRQAEQRVNARFTQCFLIAEEEVKLFHSSVSKDKPVAVLGNGLDFESFYPATDQTQKRPCDFLFTGVMDYKPNVDAVLWFVEHCWEAVKSALPDATLTIAGMNPEPEILALQSDSRITITGFVDDILPYFHAASVFIAPFRLARGVQNKVLQAAACELPVVTTSMGAEGIHFAGPDTMAIADSASVFSKACIASVLQADEARSRAARALSSIRQEYSWAQQLRALEVALERS